MAELVDAAAQKFLEKSGYNCLPLFKQEEVSALKDLYEQHFGSIAVKGMFSNHSRGVSTTELTIEIGKKMEAILEGSLKKHFKNYKFFLGAFISKQANLEEEFDLHQDWNIVNEQQKQSIQIWIPLSAVTPENGGLFVMKYSHRFYHNYRSGSFGVARLKTDKNIKPLLTPLNLVTGQCIVYYNSTFHGSYPNHDNNNRVVAIVNIVPDDLNPIYYEWNKKENRTDIYEVSPATFLDGLADLEWGRIPASFKLTRSVALPSVMNDDINSTDLATLYKQYQTQSSGLNSFFTGIKKLLSISE